MGDVAEVVRGKMTGKREAIVTGISTDTRTLKKGELFFALVGERMDGHDYLKEALRKGAIGAVVTRSRSRGAIEANQGKFVIIQVPDTLKALGDLAAFWRRQFSIPVIAVTGSNGKTTTKEMIASVLSEKFRVLKTEGNFNNLIGLPLTLFRLGPQHQVAVLEMGMNHPGEIARLAEIARPLVGVITSIGRAHLEGLKTVRQVAKAKGELLELLPKKGLAILPGDSPWSGFLRKLSNGSVTTFGWGNGSVLRGFDFEMEDLSQSSFWGKLQRKRYRFILKALGRHNATNALAALAVGEHFGLSGSVLQKGLKKFQPVSRRMEIVKGRGVTLINDGYNANPDSMRSAIELLSQVQTPRFRRKVAILGEMGELGSYTITGHRLLGKEAAGRGIDLVIAVGRFAAEVKRGAAQAPHSSTEVVLFKNFEQFSSGVKKWIQKGDLILVKGSRTARMERAVSILRR